MEEVLGPMKQGKRGMRKKTLRTCSPATAPRLLHGRMHTHAHKPTAFFLSSLRSISTVFPKYVDFLTTIT